MATTKREMVAVKDDDDDVVKWGRTRQMCEFRRYVIDRYKEIHEGNVVQGTGFYYGTIEVQFPSQGTVQDAVFTVPVVPGNPVVDSAFSLGIGDTSLTWFGTPPGGLAPSGAPHIVNPSDTNLQNPGQNLFADEVFIIEAVSARVRGMRIGYSAPDIASMIPAPTGAVLNTLQGNQMVRDQFGLMVPVELFNQYDDTFRLAKTLEEVATLHFKWQNNQVGGSGKTVDVLIDAFLNITKDQRDTKSTSGGAMTLDLPTGYIWCLDKFWQPTEEKGGTGLFDAELHLDESVTYPFKPTVIFSSRGPVIPAGIALYWEVRLYGTSLLPGRRTSREIQIRRRVK